MLVTDNNLHHLSRRERQIMDVIYQLGQATEMVQLQISGHQGQKDEESEQEATPALSHPH